MALAMVSVFSAVPDFPEAGLAGAVGAAAGNTVAVGCSWAEFPALMFSTGGA